MKAILASAFFALATSSAAASPTELCPQGTHFKRECNACKCDPKSGITRCSLAKCAGPVVDKCPRGPSFSRQCNTCHCDPRTGAISCTRKTCSAKRADRKR